ncbi:Ig-like domain-containing protein [Sphingobacterium sp. SYP-B4668]|uniref:Ig-like domain-containing protein n=1 Tax=Sphingobacterium sp. SYP-B4668 TaxID=2996035 RepID=UPI0022DD16A2|nr:Ig-like domain-containing protein [Sphingobacterium sp. SYP-B4668]
MKSKGYFPLFLHVLMTLWPIFLWADGSKDLYPNGVKGNRAYLISRNEKEQGSSSFPFFTLGTHYVYAVEGEIIATASSAQNIDDGRIRLTSPSGKQYLSNRSNVGRIMNRGDGTRNAELDGPRLGYTPFEVQVMETGVWKVEFISPIGEHTERYGDPNIPAIAADDNWMQTGDACIAAWDVSVRNREDNAWVGGRVYTNVLNLHLNSGQMANQAGAFYGRYYVLTNDGYTYRVDANGSNGIAFTSFVNNSGFLNLKGGALYKSLDYVPQVGSPVVHDPREADGGGVVTHKIWYVKPNFDMPAEAIGAMPDHRTWLINQRPRPVIERVSIVGAEGTVGYIGAKGAYLRFYTNHAGMYRVSVERLGEEGKPIVVYTYRATSGFNEIYWDGKDDEGNRLPPSEQQDVSVKISLLEGEVHFPYLDMEINPNGILLERLAIDMDEVESDLVYWDDRDLQLGKESENSKPSINLSGVSSRVNGHIWGTYRNQTANRNTNTDYGNYSFGNEKSMDTWSYAIQSTYIVDISLTVKVADLEIVSIDHLVGFAAAGDEVTYMVKVRNNGPSKVGHATFDFLLPVGFEIVGLTGGGYQYDSGRASGTGNYYSCLLDLLSNQDLLLEIKAIVPQGAPASDRIVARATIVRSADVIDPDATSEDVRIKAPQGAEQECSVGCNNIAVHSGMRWAEAISSLPMGVSDLVVTKQRVKATVDVLFNDKFDGAAVVLSTLKLERLPKYGEAWFDVNGNLVYQPEADFDGVDELTYTVKDEKGGQVAPTLVTIKVIKRTPTAYDDYIVGQVGSDLSIPILNNDKSDGDAELDIHSIRIVAGPKDGMLRLENGHVIYRPQDRFSGKDSFVYQVRDVLGNWTNEAVVNITVSGFFVPNVFTPNDDGMNDEFVVMGTGYYDRISLTVWTRAGKEVFSSGDYRNDWQAEGVEDMTYFYTVSAYKSGEKNVVKSGYILISRRISK